MSKTKYLYACVILLGVCFFVGGCVDAVRDGVTSGVSNGISSLIGSSIAQIADMAFGGA